LKNKTMEDFIMTQPIATQTNRSQTGMYQSARAQALPLPISQLELNLYIYLRAAVVGTLLGMAFVITGCSKSQAQADSIGPATPAAETAPASTDLTPVLQPPSITVGLLAVAGAGCAALSLGQQPIISDTQIVIPAETEIVKSTASGLGRGACTTALPVQVPQGYRLLIEKIDVVAASELSPSSNLDGTIEIFTAPATSSEFIDISEKSRASKRQASTTLSTASNIVTGCGASFNLRTNASLVLRNGTDISSARFSGVTMKYKLEACAP
jgi:hypothetical protein